MIRCVILTLQFLFAYLVTSNQISNSYTQTFDGVSCSSNETDMVFLHAPENVTLAYVTSTTALIHWTEPANYINIDFHWNETEVFANTTLKRNMTIASDLENNNTMLSSNHTRWINNSLWIDGTFIPDDMDINDTHLYNYTDYSIGVSVNDSIPDQNGQSQPRSNFTLPSSIADIHSYIVIYTSNSTSIRQERELPGNVTTFRLDSLQTGSKYHVSVMAKYACGIKLVSHATDFITRGYGPHNPCECDYHGRDPYDSECKPHNRHVCRCRIGHTGFLCELCKEGFYRPSSNSPCHRCPCSSHHSTGVCYFRRGHLRCRQCAPGYRGALCHICAYGFFPYKSNCRKCQCYGNHDPNQPFMCSPATGQCYGCLHNTTGFHCTECAEGYVGDAVRAKNCTLKSDLLIKTSPVDSLSVGVIAAICIGVILLLSLIAGFIVYWKCKVMPMKAFWTVELRHEPDVSFSKLPEDDGDVMTGQQLDDVTFYENHSPRRSRSKDYAPLKEEL